MDARPFTLIGGADAFMETPDTMPTAPTTELVKPVLPEPVARRGIAEWQWRTLMNSLYPGAKGESVLLVWDYCKSRNLDPLKKPCHIVPMEVKVGENKYEWRDVVMPGVYELRTTAQRTGEYLGHSKAEYGPTIETAGLKAPEWCEMTMYRWNATIAQRAEYPVRVLFNEVVATKRDGRANARWTKAPVQMLTKCCEAAGLREAFPDEVGGITTDEEMDGQRAITVQATAPAESGGALVKPEGYDEWTSDLVAAANASGAKLAETWKNAKPFLRHYLMAAEPESWDSLKARADAVDQAAAQVGEVAQ
jgi:phage recombination protein Bet